MKTRTVLFSVNITHLLGSAKNKHEVFSSNRYEATEDLIHRDSGLS